MPRNEEGEFELVLGNRQLLSVFFIVVVLLGVFFVMGYILGKNATPSPGSDLASVGKTAEPSPSSSPIIIDKGSTKSSAAMDTPAPKPVEKPVERPAEKAATPPPPKPESKPEPKKTEAAKTEPARQPAPPPATSDTRTGMPPKGSLFLQVAAVGRAEADVVAKVLRGKGYDLWIAPTDNEKLFRVLVGPIQRDTLGKNRGELEGLGFKPFPRTY